MQDSTNATLAASVDAERSSDSLETPRRAWPGVAGLTIRTVFHVDAETTARALLESEAGADRDARRLFEIPRDHYDETLRLIRQQGMAGGPKPDGPMPALIERLRPATVTYRQALHSARSGKNGGVSLAAETQAVRSDCPYGLSFAIDFARARRAGADERAAVMLALRTSLDAGPQSALGDVLAARLDLDDNALKSAVTGGAISGIAQSPLSRAAVDQATRTFVTLAGQAPSGELGMLASANPLAALLAAGVVNLDFYRAALEHSISWTQFTKNMLIKTSAMLGGISGWAGGAAFGAGAAGPFGALIGGLVGGLSGGSLGSAGAKRFGDRFVKDDAQRMLTIVRERSEALALEYLLSGPEVEAFAARIKTQVTPSWLRAMYRAGSTVSRADEQRREALSAAFAHKALAAICADIVDQREPVELPEAETIAAVLAQIGS